MNKVLQDLIEEIWMLGVNHREEGIPEMDKALKEFYDKLIAFGKDVIGEDEVVTDYDLTKSEKPMEDSIAINRNELRHEQRKRLVG